MEARSARWWNGSTVAGVVRSARTPAASALRAREPMFAGSCTPWATARSPRAAGGAPQMRAFSKRGRWKTPTTPCGVSTGEMRRKMCGRTR